MNTQSSTTKYTNLNFIYDWIEKEFFPRLKNSANEFWQFENTKYKLLSITNDTKFLFQGEEYFVTRIKLNSEIAVTIRLSGQICEFLLKEVLGEPQKAFDLAKISELEAKILTGYNDFLYENMSKLFKKVEKYDSLIANDSTNITFFIKKDEMDYGKIIVSIPNQILSPIAVETQENFNLRNFPSSLTTVNIKVGEATLTLQELKNMEKDDIVILDKSNLNKMTLLLKGGQVDFELNPDPGLMIDFDEGEKNMATEEKDVNQNVWDSLQVDISAEFDKVKMPLGDIRQISEGLVVDIGSIFDNKIFLKVDNKTIAQGELVIINDRYGVRVEQLIETTQEEPFKEEQNITENIETVEKNEENSEEEDFDYSDFDVDEDEADETAQ